MNTADFQLSQEAWKQLSSQMNEIVETNKLFKKAIQGTYKKLTNVQKQSLRNSLNPKKTATKTGKIVESIDNKIEHYKNDRKRHKKNSNDIKKDKANKNDSRTEIQVSDLDISTEIQGQ